MASLSSTIIVNAVNSGGVANSDTEVEVVWNSFLLGTYNSETNKQSVTCTFSLYVRAKKLSSGGEESQNRQVSVWLNGTQQVSNNSDTFGTNTYISDGKITSIHVVLHAEGRSNIAAGPAKNDWVSVNLDFTANITDINPTTDFVFLKNMTYNFLRLPDPHQRTTAPIFIKIDGLGKRVWVVSDGFLVSDTNQPGVYFQDDFGCLTLISDGALTSPWCIANYYPSPNQGSLGGVTSNPMGIKSGNATENAVNIFDTAIDPSRLTGDNRIYLPVVTSPSICVVAYSGPASKVAGNALVFRSNMPDPGIDGFDTNSVRPYITADAAGKSVGIVFICNGLKWFVAGYYYTSWWSWYSGETSNASISSTPTQKTLIIPPSTDKHYLLPTTIPTNPYFFIIKVKGTPNSSDNIFITDPTSASFNDSSVTALKFSRNQTNMCLWIFGSILYDDNTRTSWYPCIGYTPNY